MYLYTMKHFTNDYQEPQFIKLQPLNCKIKATPFNCSIKDSTLKIEVKTIEIRGYINLLRYVATIKEQLRKFFKLPERIELIKLSNKCGFYFGEKELKANIVTEKRVYKGRQTITVKTDISNRYLTKI